MPGQEMHGAHPDISPSSPGRVDREMTEALEDQFVRLCRTAVEVAAADGCGVTLMTRSGQSLTVHSTDSRTKDIEDLQHTLGEGPGVTAAQSGTPVMVPDFGDLADHGSQRWPAFAKEVATIDFKAAFAFPLLLGATCVGAFSLYRTNPGPLSSAQATSTKLTAQSVALVLARGGLGSLNPDGDPMQVHQAAGMVMVQLGVSIDEALLHIRAASYAGGQTADALAEDIVSRRRRLSKEEK